MDEKISFIKHYKSSIEKNQDDPERVLHCLKKLQNIRINVQHLHETGLGKTVNSVRRFDGEVGELAKKLVAKWKSMVAEDDQNYKNNLKEEIVETIPEKIIDSKRSKHSIVTDNSENNKISRKSSSKLDNKEEKNSEKKSSEGKHHHHHHSRSHHSNSSASSHKTSKKRNHEDAAESKENETKTKKYKIDHEESDTKSIKNIEYKESTSNSNKSKKKEQLHKHSSSSSSSSKRKHSNEEESNKEFDGAQGIGFAEALASFDMPSTSSKHKKDQLADKIVKINSTFSNKSLTSKSSSPKKIEKEKDKKSSSSAYSSSHPSTSGETKKSLQSLTQPPRLLTQKPKLDILPDIVNELPIHVIPDYRPLPLNSAMKDYINSNVYGTSSIQSRHTRSLTDAELLVESFSSKANRTRVFSGNSKTRALIPKLFDMCIRVLQENIDYLESTGGVPFDILKPVLDRAKPEQLEAIEYYNPYLLDDSDILWKPHCQRKWKNKQPTEMETWRDMFIRCTKEDEEKLNRLTQNIRQHQEISDKGIQKTKMAFVDSFVKPPRNVMKKQEQFGTNRKLVVSPAARVESLRNLTSAGDVRLRVAAGLRDDAQQVVGRGNIQRGNIQKKAPMMAKILQKFKR